MEDEDLFQTARQDDDAPRLTTLDRLFHRYFQVRSALAAAAAAVACAVQVLDFQKYLLLRLSVVAVVSAFFVVLLVVIPRLASSDTVLDEDDDDTTVDEPVKTRRLDSGVIDPYASFHRSAREHYDSPCLGERPLKPDGTRGRYQWLTCA